MVGKKCIIRGDRSGLFYGVIVSIEGSKCEMKNAQKLAYWSGAACAEQLSQEGTKNPDSCKFTIVVPTITIYDLIQHIPCSTDAILNIEAVKVWKIK